MSRNNLARLLLDMSEPVVVMLNKENQDKLPMKINVVSRSLYVNGISWKANIAVAKLLP
jgi:hypothetical protein